MSRMIGIIGGSGIYAIPGVKIHSSRRIETPFGDPSADVTFGSMHGLELAFIPRHGHGHRYSPSEVPYAANIYALKSLGVDAIISFNAVGSLREEIEPRHFVVPDQLFDRTKGIRRSTFFDGGVVAHAPFGDPYCPGLRKLLVKAAESAGAVVHDGGTLVIMEGPAFSTRAESEFYRSQGWHLIGMTALPEAKLAREAGLCFATLAMSTDYDCWRQGEEDVTLEMVLEVVKDNVRMAGSVLAEALLLLAEEEPVHCECSVPVGHMTFSDARSREKMSQLEIVLKR
ncbi:S-methyl-5'-thioadenosine phosphorylase [Candidatus Fermentibacteria bacterium]|nr:MAG: S-methyl-5'-thioadenosine phosphorylase [Candidatus Fermentibacteria bacterium]